MTKYVVFVIMMHLVAACTCAIDTIYLNESMNFLSPSVEADIETDTELQTDRED